MSGTAKQLQEVIARAGYWLDEDTAVRLTEEAHRGLPLTEVIEQVLDAVRPLTADEKAKLAAVFTDPPCPKCGVPDPDEDCRGAADFGSKPLPYRHAGRVPRRKGNPRLDGPALTDLGQWDTEAARAFSDPKDCEACDRYAGADLPPCPKHGGPGGRRR